MHFFKKEPVLVEINAQVTWHVARDPNDGHWFGVCPALNLNAAGDNWTDFQECANEAISLLFESLFKSGDLEAFLGRNGWRTTGPLPTPGTKAHFTVPFGIEHKARVQELAGISISA